MVGYKLFGKLQEVLSFPREADDAQYFEKNTNASGWIWTNNHHDTSMMHLTTEP